MCHYLSYLPLYISYMNAVKSGLRGYCMSKILSVWGVKPINKVCINGRLIKDPVLKETVDSLPFSKWLKNLSLRNWSIRNY